MQNNGTLLAVRYLPGSVLLGGGWERGSWCWCQDLHLKGGKEGREFNSCFSVTVVSILGRAECGLSVTPVLWLSPPAVAGWSKQPCFGWQVLHNASGSWEDDVESLPLTLCSSKSQPSNSIPFCACHPFPPQLWGCCHPPARTWEVVLGVWLYKHGLFITLTAWLVWGQLVGTFSLSAAWWHC